MKIIVDPNCPVCNGVGEIMESVGPYDNTYVVSYTCLCVSYQHTDAEKKILARLTKKRS